MLNKLKTILETLLHLRFIQIYYQIYYRLRNRLFVKPVLPRVLEKQRIHDSLEFYPFFPVGQHIDVSVVPLNNINFTFLNKSVAFTTKAIDWNYNGHGKLWTYNLNYFEFLFYSELSHKTKVELLKSFCDNSSNLKDGLDPYPTSLRLINWIKYFISINHHDEALERFIIAQGALLYNSIEYHLLANHLLENAFALLFVSVFTGDQKIYQKAVRILKAELVEQILTDGAHFERSVMYHQIILFRLLDSINLLKYNKADSELLPLMEDKASYMMSWLMTVTDNGEIFPQFNDSSPCIAPSSLQLMEYFQGLSLKKKIGVKLGASGFRFLSQGHLKILFSQGEIGPKYQPGHAHSDELNFLLWSADKPLITEIGTSTYEKNDRRELERSTSAHNCIYVNSKNSSNVWGGFRVGKRAKVRLIEDSQYEKAAVHDGFKDYGLGIQRKIKQINDSFEIEDVIEGWSTNHECFLNLHFHPKSNLSIERNHILLDDVQITFEGYKILRVEKFMFAHSFNHLEEANRLIIKAESKNKITIRNVS